MAKRTANFKYGYKKVLLKRMSRFRSTDITQCLQGVLLW